MHLCQTAGGGYINSHELRRERMVEKRFSRPITSVVAANDSTCRFDGRCSMGGAYNVGKRMQRRGEKLASRGTQDALAFCGRMSCFQCTVTFSFPAAISAPLQLPDHQDTALQFGRRIHPLSCSGHGRAYRLDFAETVTDLDGGFSHTAAAKISAVAERDEKFRLRIVTLSFQSNHLRKIFSRERLQSMTAIYALLHCPAAWCSVPKRSLGVRRQ